MNVNVNLFYCLSLYQVPFRQDLTLTVSKLKPNQRYMAAVSAFDSKGKLIGENIGSSGRPVLASHPLPLLLAYGYLARVNIKLCC